MAGESLPEVSVKLAEMRRAFDAAFARASIQTGAALADFLAVRVCDDAYVVPLREVASVARAGRIVPVPSRSPLVLGLAGVRGIVVPVFGLAALLGYPARETPRWLMLSGEGDRAIALGVSRIEGSVKIAPEEIAPASAGGGTYDVATTRTGARAVISVASLIERLGHGGYTAEPAGAAGKER